jgi:glutamate racemase
LIEALTEREWGDNSPPREVAVTEVAVFATPATVASRAFQRELAFRAIGVDVEAQACGGVVDAIEDGDMILAEALVRSHVDALKRKMPAPQAAILGCKYIHKPILWPKALRIISTGVLILSELAKRIVTLPAATLRGSVIVRHNLCDEKFLSNPLDRTEFLKKDQ